jgi:hypothetical protein
LAAPLVFIRISSISWIRLSWMTTNEILLNF